MVHGRDRGRGEVVVRGIREETGNQRVRCYLADFSSLSEVRRLAREVQTTKIAWAG